MKLWEGLLAALIIVIPLTLAILFGNSMMATETKNSQDPNFNDHLMLQKLENQTSDMNKTLTNVANFLQQQQIPFDNIISKQVQNLTNKH